MKKGIIGLFILTIAIVLAISLYDNEPDKSQFTNTSGYQHKSFGSSSSLDGKLLVLSMPGTYVFELRANMESGSMSVTLLNEARDRELLKIEGSNLDETKQIELDAGTYAVQIETYDAKQGEFTLRYNAK